MFKRKTVLLALAALALTASPANASGSAVHVALEEAQAAGSAGAADEFVVFRIVNTSAAAVVIGGIELNVCSPTNGLSTAYTVPSSTTLAAGAQVRYVVAGTGYSGSRTPTVTVALDLDRLGGVRLEDGTSVFDRVAFGDIPLGGMTPVTAATACKDGDPAVAEPAPNYGDLANHKLTANADNFSDWKLVPADRL